MCVGLPVVEEQMAIIVLLLEANADISLGKSDTGATAIHIASQEGHTPIVKLLAENRAGIDTKTNDDGDHPVWIAAQNGKSYICIYDNNPNCITPAF